MQKTFLYNAHGSALGGFITRPFNEVIESVASISLPVSGGYGSAEVKNYDYHQLIKFNRAYSQVSGSQNPADGSYNTLVSVTIEGLTVADMITARRIVARITTKHSADNTETRVVPTGSEFVDLRIAGEPVEGLTCDPMLTELDTYEKARGR
ncbi:MAG TPA: choice-of-anchor P family protein, partial [Terriglobales bacterium]|nr:choice-of-anchor P family protein [Terriglobales bacterium]